jgi:hypothetical protein
MFPDKTNAQGADPAALPHLQGAPVSAGPPSGMPGGAFSAFAPPAAQPIVPAQQVKQLVEQYGTNPYSFNAAFQQLKTRYLGEHHHIDLNADQK